MGKKRTEKNKYPSRYSPGGFVHAAQYITELICEKKAQNEKKELPLKFWELKQWLTYYRYQLVLANKLVKKYGEHAVIAALRDNRSWRTFSLRNPLLDTIIQEYKKQEELSSLLAKDIEYDFSEKKTFDSNNNKPSIISKLKDLE